MRHRVPKQPSTASERQTHFSEHRILPNLLSGNPGGNLASSSNGSTGLGWLIQRRELYNGGAANRATKTVLQLIDMNDGGDSVTSRADWQPKQTIDLTGVAEGWHRLSIAYDPATGDVTAQYDSNLYNFTSTPGLIGNFYVGWRENLPGANAATGRPPTYDLFVAGLAGDFNTTAKWMPGTTSLGVRIQKMVRCQTTTVLRRRPLAITFGVHHLECRTVAAGRWMAARFRQPSAVGLAAIGSIWGFWRDAYEELDKPQAVGKLWRSGAVETANLNRCRTGDEA